MRFPTLLLIFALISTALAAPEGRFWILRTDHITAESLQKAITGESVPAAQLEEKISSLISAKTITELANFNDEFSEPMNFETDLGTIEIKEIEEIVPMGIRLQSSPNVSPNGPLVDISIDLTLMEKGKRNQYSEQRIVTSTTLTGEQWHWHHHWTRTDDTTILLTKFSSVPERKGDRSITSPTLFLNYELLSVSPADLEKFGKSTPATREKATARLQAQATILDGTRLICRSKERAEHRNQTQFLTDKGGEWDTWNGGSLLELQPVIGPNGKKVDLNIKLSWQDPSDPQEEAEYHFGVVGAYDVGNTTIINPSTEPKNATTSIIMSITPEVAMPPAK